jgi:general secretion pathway protein A
MYLAHYGLRAKPFSLSPDSKFLWLGEKHKEALATLQYGILEEKGFVLLTGDVGTGKTVLINALIDQLDMAVVVAKIADPDLEPLDFFNLLSEEFGLNQRFDSKGAFLIGLKEFLTTSHASDKNVLLIIDEAQRLSHEALEQIRLLSNIEMHHKKLINIFFVGQSEFNTILRQAKNKAVRQRIAASYHIDPLSERETIQYVHHRLHVAGAGQEIFTAKALQRIFAFSGGYPRMINVICDHALLTGYAAGYIKLDDKVIRECEQDFDLSPAVNNSPGEAVLNSRDSHNAISSAASPKSFNSLKTGLGFALIILIILAGFYVYEVQLESPTQWAIEEIAPKQNKRLLPKDQKDLIAELKNKKTLESDQKLEQGALAKLNDLVKSSWKKIDSQLDKLKPAADSIALPGGKVIVNFELNSNELSEQASEKLDQAVTFFSHHPESQIIIEGYTDSHGNYEYNKTLSKHRADIIKSYFAGQGIPPSQIKTYGRGPQNPIANNNTFEGRKKNRRVEISVKMNE